MQHMKILNGDKKHKCQYCGKDFLQLSHMRQHLRTHVGGKDFKCDHCPKAFRQKSHLLQHMRMHTGDKKYTCEICQRKFTQLSHLQQHIRTHTGDKPYKCSSPGCLKAFSQLSNLQSHSRTHQADKPFKCNACYKCFGDEASLLEHIPKHKESKHLKTHICRFCGKSYTQEAYLSKHMSKHADKEAKQGAPPTPSIPQVHPQVHPPHNQLQSQQINSEGFSALYWSKEHASSSTQQLLQYDYASAGRSASALGGELDLGGAYGGPSTSSSGAVYEEQLKQQSLSASGGIFAHLNIPSVTATSSSTASILGGDFVRGPPSTSSMATRGFYERPLEEQSHQGELLDP